MSDLPPGWTEVVLGDICEFRYGKSLPAAKRSGSGYPVFGSNGQVGAHSTTVTKAPAIVIGRKGSFGEVHWSDQPCWPIDTTYFVDAAATDADLRWLFHRLRCLGLTELNRAAAIPGLNREDAYRKKLLLPPLEEQRRIAAILDKADQLRAKRRAALEHLDSLTQSIFLDMFGDPVGNSRAWPRSALGEVAATASGGTPDRAEPRYFGGAIRWVKSGELHSGVVVDTEETLTPEGLANSAAKLLPPGTLLVAMYGATAGVVATLGVSAATNQAVCSITPGPRIDGTFLTQVLRLMSRKLLARRHGGAQPNLSQKVIRHLEIPVPPLDMQTQFAQTFDRVKRCAAMSSDSAERADALLASLQSRAFRGEL